MVEHVVNHSVVVGRMDIRSGVGRRRRWSEAEKGRIVTESFAPGAVVSEVARRHEISPQHLFLWRKAAKAGRLVLPAEPDALFAPLMIERAPDGARPDGARHEQREGGPIEIEVGAAVVRIRAGADLGLLAEVIGLLKAQT